ncbi:hypothetical protein D9M71_411720 [compost metagenome]
MESDDEHAAGTGAEEAVIEADDQASQRHYGVQHSRRQLALLDRTILGGKENENAERDQCQDDLAHRFLRDRYDQVCPQVGA